MPGIYSSIVEIKVLLGIDPANNTQNALLNFYNTWAGDIIELALNRPGGFLKASRTIYLNGTGTQKLLCPQRPIFASPVPVLYENGGEYWGQGDPAPSNPALEYGKSYVVMVNSEDGSNVSKAGILYKIDGTWKKPFLRSPGVLSSYLSNSGFGNIKLTYVAGATIDNTPPIIRMAANLLVARMAYIFPLGMELSGESYEERSISLGVQNKNNYLMSLIKPLLYPYLRNWKW